MLEFEEPDPIEASHLVSAQCRECGSKALCVPERARSARCGACLGGGVVVTGVKPGPVVRYGVFSMAPPEEVIREAYPQPTYIGAVGGVDDIEFVQCPAPVRALAGYAREQSWEVRSQYTRGRFPHGTTGRPGAEKHVISLRFGGHPMTDRQAYAIYARGVSGGTWTWQSVAVWGPALPPYLGCGLADLSFFLNADVVGSFSDERMLTWVRELKDREAGKDDARKAREARRREIRKAFAEIDKAVIPSVTIAKLAAQYGMTADEVTAIVSKSSGSKRESGG